MIKRVSLLTRKPEIGREEFLRHWRDIHGELAKAVPGVRRYIQSTVTETPTRADIPTAPLQVDGIAELWYDDEETMRASVASPEARALYDDGALFIGEIRSFVVDEATIIDK